MIEQATANLHVLDDPPPFHYKLLDYGERPYWSRDGRRIAFVDKHYGDICETDLATREVRNLTHDLDCLHLFLRVLILHDGNYLLIGPREYKHPDISRHGEKRAVASGQGGEVAARAAGEADLGGSRRIDARPADRLRRRRAQRSVTRSAGPV